MDRRVYDRREAWGFYQESSTRTPDFHKKSKLSQRLPINSYDWYRIDGLSPLEQTYRGLRSERDARGFVTFDSAAISGLLNNQVGQTASCASRSEALNRVQNRLFEKVRDQDIDLGVALGEYRETAAFVSTCMVNAAKALKQLRKGDVYGAFAVVRDKRGFDRWRDVPDAAANTWLGYQYALSPIMSDAYKATKILFEDQKPYVEVLRARSALTLPTAAHILAKEGAPPRTYLRENRIVGQHKVRGEVLFTVNNPLLRAVDQLGLTNPLSVAWELVPLSFVVDWFVPVGNLLSSVVAPQGVDFVDGWVSCRTAGVSYARTDNLINGGTWKTVASSTEVRKYRRKLASFPSYNLVVPDLSLSKQQLASGMALLHNALRHKW